MRRLTLLALALLPVLLRAAPLAAGSGQVTLPLADYVDLVAAAERAEQVVAERARVAEQPVHQVVAYDLHATLEGGVVRMETRFDVEVRGQPRQAVRLAVPGRASRASIAPDGRGAALHREETGDIVLVAPIAGRYRVIVASAADVDRLEGRLDLPATGAPVAIGRLVLPAGIDVASQSLVTVDDRRTDGGRQLRFALDRDRVATLLLGRSVDAALADHLLTRTAVVTVAELGRDGLRRRDVVVHEVLRGALTSFELTLPNGYDLDRADTDEGQMVPRQDDRSVTIARHATLRDQGHVVLTARPSATPHSLSLAPVEPSIAPTARFLVLAPQIAAEATPSPRSAWQRVDLEDLPDAVASEIAAIRPSAAWRLIDPRAPVRLDVEPLPEVARLGTIVRRRGTTTVLTLDGVVVHRDRLDLEHAGSSLEVTLPPAARFWSAQVGGEPVRPVPRGDALAVPLPFRADGRAEVEIVTMAPRALPEGRGELAFDLPALGVPVIEHDWHLLLPEGKRYRLAGSTLYPVPLGTGRPRSVAEPGAARPADRPSGIGLRGIVLDTQGDALPGVSIRVTSATGGERHTVSNDTGRFALWDLAPDTYALVAELDGFSLVEYPSVVVRAGRATTLEITLSPAVEETITVTAESPANSGWALERYLGSFADKPSTTGPGSAEHRRAVEDAVEGLQQGLTGGVKPLAIELPTTGKLLRLTGALPPSQVQALLDVRPDRRRR